jgi:hypothetical protein
MTIMNIPGYVLTHSKSNEVFSDDIKWLSLATMARLRSIMVLLQNVEMQREKV